MKTMLRTKSTAFLLSAAFVCSVASVRADDPKPVTHHHHVKTVKADSADQDARRDHSTRVEGANTIPTRDDRNSREVFGGAANGGSGPEYRVPTGSQLPKHYNRRAHTTDNEDNEYIVDKNDQRVQSKNNVGDTLRNIPGVTVSGMR